MSNNSTIKCPNCKHEFPIGHALAAEIENDIKARYLKRFNDDKQTLEAERAKMAKEREDLLLQAENQEKLISDKVRLAKEQLLEEARKKAAEEMNQRLESLNIELTEKSKKLRDSEVKELELMRKQREIEEREGRLKLELEKQMLERQREIEEKAKKTEGERFELKIKELEKKLEDQVQLAETMRRKMEQGSMQLQGEVQELALEELLRGSFPFDRVEEVSKGVKGADCMQIVLNAQAVECGKIIYESKRTKAFTNEWIEKLKLDMRNQKADVAVIVTEALPRDMSSFGMKDGVYICRFNEVRALAFLLRERLIQISQALASQENKGDKMHMLYDYLTGNEFRQHIEAVVEGFVSMKETIGREKLQMEKLWKEREKQLEKVLLNTTQFYGSIKGIAGNAVGDIKLLEE
ncbi:MAG: DUF2130 domain-containing protein [Bacteroidia bacterium]|jgi:hypothetical protein|nr:DUF2130 domain-containing protein [Bacteroidia bacterium]